MGVKVVETSLRDGHQSLFATRMTTDEVLLALSELDKAGFYALEVWGGATFDACLRFLNEDPWDRLRQIKKVCKNTKLQMLFRGQNILGYRHYADDVVEKFVEKAIKKSLKKKIGYGRYKVKFDGYTVGSMKKGIFKNKNSVVINPYHYATYATVFNFT